MMANLKLRKSLLISKQILLSFIDVMAFGLDFFDRRGYHRELLSFYEDFRLENKKKFSQELFRLKHQGLIKVSKNTQKIYLTKRGIQKLKKLSIESIEIEKPKKWDKKWRLISFDIPKKFSKSRDIFRNKLTEFGFAELQESLYVYPYECYKEISFIRDLLGITNFVEYIEANKLESSKNIKAHFKNF